MNCCSTNTEVGWDPDEFYAIRPECAGDVPPTHFRPKPGRTLSARRWHASFTEDGHLDIAKVLSRIQRGGIHPTIKGPVWEFLLGCYDPKSSFNERDQLRQHRRSEYDNLKAKCKEMEPTIGSGKLLTMPVITKDGHPIDDHLCVNSQDDTPPDETSPIMPDNVIKDKDVIQWKLSLSQIGLDVIRTDRTLLYYESEETRARLWDLLAVYAWIDKDISYCQGMSDLCSPISIILENEADAFWCFERLMRRLRGNFKCTDSSIGVRSQLAALSSVMKVVDPKLHRHIEDLNGGEYLFAFRMLMVMFRREFSFVDSLYLWEMMWAMEYNPKLFTLYESDAQVTGSGGISGNKKEFGKFERKNLKTGMKGQQVSLSVFLVASVLEAKNKRFLTEATALDEVVKIFNDITGKLDAKKACHDALKLHRKYLTKVKTE